MAYGLTRRGVMVVLGLAVATPARSAVAQRMRPTFAPRPGALIHMITETHGTVLLDGLTAVPDGSGFETDRRVNVTERVLERRPGGWAVDVTVDSVRLQRRPTDGKWKVETDSLHDGTRARATVNDRFGIVGLESSGPNDAEVLRALGGSVAGVGFAFPAEAVPVGTSFPTGSRFAYIAELNAPGLPPVRETLVGSLTLTLDSVVVSGSDSLAYFGFHGTFDPRSEGSQGEAEEMSATYGGAFAGVLVWSVGWNAFVSAASRIRANGKIHAEGPDGAQDVTARWDVVTRHRVRP